MRDLTLCSALHTREMPVLCSRVSEVYYIECKKVSDLSNARSNGRIIILGIKKGQWAID